ncbi:hypothetical protein L1765_14000 [Microaerobacter geothermalis]|uniref:hypothetical protein n=1 Tax=Microaerobacter geothermalis TaxID=674972 RepID=UPI001F42A9F8|nr:hypothetical protein [Microaerobacter geothermalis]MCF6095072.1 hypothetical protein [Microaerobacter geothermalis]
MKKKIMEYQYNYEGKAYCCNWTIQWNFKLEPFVKDGESSGVGRFLGIDDGQIAVQMWFVEPGIKIENGQGYSVMLDTESKVITILKKDE